MTTEELIAQYTRNHVGYSGALNTNVSADMMTKVASLIELVDAIKANYIAADGEVNIKLAELKATVDAANLGNNPVPEDLAATITSLIADKHSHNNKQLLDSITQSTMDSITASAVHNSTTDIHVTLPEKTKLGNLKTAAEYVQEFADKSDIGHKHLTSDVTGLDAKLHELEAAIGAPEFTIDNTLAATVPGKALDAVQGKFLNDNKADKTEVGAKANTADVYSKADADGKVEEAVNLLKDGVPVTGNTLNKLNNKFADKADSVNVYTKAETYTRTEVNTKLDAKVTKPATVVTSKAKVLLDTNAGVVHGEFVADSGAKTLDAANYNIKNCKVGINANDVLVSPSNLSGNQNKALTVNSSGTGFEYKAVLPASAATEIQANSTDITDLLDSVSNLDTRVANVRNYILPIGPWNMQAETTRNVALTTSIARQSIIGVEAFVHSDNSDTIIPMTSSEFGSVVISANYVTLTRISSPPVNLDVFNNAYRGRGYIVIRYIPGSTL